MNTVIFKQPKLDQKNTSDIQLLYNNPNKLLLRYQDLIKIVIKKFIRDEKISPHDYDDAIQHVNELLITRIPRIQKQFKGNSLLRTYFTSIIRNICLEYCNNQKNHVHLNQDFIQTKPDPKNILTNFFIKQETQRLQFALNQLNNDQHKFELCYKVKHNIPIKVGDIIKYNREISCKSVQDLLKILKFSKSEHGLIELNNFINFWEKKKISKESLLKWIRRKEIQLIELLNGSHKSYAYNEETLQYLTEVYYYNLN